MTIVGLSVNLHLPLEKQDLLNLAPPFSPEKMLKVSELDSIVPLPLHSTSGSNSHQAGTVLPFDKVTWK